MAKPRLKNKAVRRVGGQSLNITEGKLARLREIMPDVFSEDEVDWEKLRVALGAGEFKDERYHLNWAGKSDVFRALQSPTAQTLSPCRKESVDFDGTGNIFIEGENLAVLKVLQKSCFGKIKMIYIDPPYNTGNDHFIYPDRFAESKKDYMERVGDVDEEGALMREGLFHKNSRDNGHYHSNWLSMMYPRLFLARNLLSEDGVIFISIDDNEAHNLRMVMNEIFGEENFVAMIPWHKRTAKSDVPFGVSQDHEWIILYARMSFTAGEIVERKYHKSDDQESPWRHADLTTQRSKEERPNAFFAMTNPKDGKKYPANPNRVWGVTKDTFRKYYDKGKIIFPGDYEFLKITVPAFRIFEHEDKEKNLVKFDSDNALKAVSTALPLTVGKTSSGTKESVELFGGKIFPFPKPASLIKHLIKIIPQNDFTVLDFFAGSCTTAHAVLDLNKEDRGNRKFICVQMPEPCDEKSEARKAGYKTIADIGKERIRRVIKKGKLNAGFKVFKLCESNFEQWRGGEIKTEEDLEKQLQIHTNPVKKNASTEGILYELLLKHGMYPAIDIEDKGGWYLVGDEGQKVAVALKSVDNKTIKAIIKAKPATLITLDMLFENNDQLKTNVALQMEDAGVDFKVA